MLFQALGCKFDKIWRLKTTSNRPTNRLKVQHGCYFLIVSHMHSLLFRGNIPDGVSQHHKEDIWGKRMQIHRR